MKQNHPHMAGLRTRCAYCDWHDLLTAKETILLVLQGGTVTISGISVKLWDLGVRFKPAENEVRARLSELRNLGMVREAWQGGQVWRLTDLGEHELAEITPHLYDDELAGFSK